MTIYEAMRQACKSRNTNISTALKETGHSNGNTGAWKTGTSPRIDICMDVAKYLGITIDELVYGPGAVPRMLDEDETSLVDMYRMIPEDRRPMCLDFIRSHIVPPEKFTGKIDA